MITFGNQRYIRGNDFNMKVYQYSRLDWTILAESWENVTNSCVSIIGKMFQMDISPGNM